MPSITAINPSSFDDGATVTLTGTGFGSAQGNVTIGGVTQGVTSWSNTSIQFAAVRGSQSLGACRVDVEISASPPPIHTTIYAAGWGQTASAGGTITGPAPLAIWCDAVGTTHDDTSIKVFHHCGYHWDFGYATPTTPGSWTHSGKPKGNQIGGPCAAHVYETPGTYTLSVRAQDADGNYEDASLTIVVQDTDTYWTTGGRTTTTISTTTGAWSAWASNSRYLLNAGSDYTARGNINLNGLQNVCIAKTGGGADPIVANVFINNSPSASVPPAGQSFQFVQLESTGRFEFPMVVADALVYQCVMEDFTAGGIIRGRYINYPAQTWLRPTRVGVWECEIDEALADYPFISQMWQFMFVGNRSRNPQFHSLRWNSGARGFIAHNRFLDAADGYHSLTIRSAGVDEATQALSASSIDLRTEYVVAADNYLAEADDLGSWCLEISPPNATTACIINDIIAERSRFGNRSTAPSRWDFVRGAGVVTIRDSTYDNGDTLGAGASPNFGVPPSPYQNGPWYSNVWEDTVDGTYRLAAPASILPSKAGT